MVIRGIFAERPALFQLLSLLFLILAGGLLSSLIGLWLFTLLYSSSANLMENPEMLRLIQFLAAIGTFLVPALIMAFFCSSNIRKYLYASTFPKGKTIILTILSVVLISPFISLTGILNKMVKLPDILYPIEAWMQAKEVEAEKLTTLMLSGEGLIILIQNIFVVAVVAAITEEFLFRGTLRQVFSKTTKNQHLIVWLAAIVFSLFHMQFYGFIPRMLLGAYFGYLLLWGNNIWLPVIAHFSNNFLGVVSLTNPNLAKNEFITGNVSTENMLPFTFVSISFAILFIFCIMALKRELREK